jgi:hypothetical protein
MKDLHIKYRSDTGHNAVVSATEYQVDDICYHHSEAIADANIGDDTFYTSDYVQWLERKIEEAGKV